MVIIMMMMMCEVNFRLQNVGLLRVLPQIINENQIRFFFLQLTALVHDLLLLIYTLPLSRKVCNVMFLNQNHLLG
jgi:hypothetical protein